MNPDNFSTTFDISSQGIHISFMIHTEITYPWHYLEQSQLLMLPLNRLDMDLEETWMIELIEQLADELEAKGIEFRPYFYISTEWFTADHTTGIAIPFYLLDSKLWKLEKKHTGHIDGKDRESIMKILRHECGHAIDNAYNLRRFKSRQNIFGSSKKRYPVSYLPDRKSKNYVRYLSEYYAQAHPDEDFAETFATWLDPSSNWQSKYKNWDCINKLEYMDSLMSSLPAPKQEKRQYIDAIDDLQISLNEHYTQKRKVYQKPKLDHLGVVFSKSANAITAKEAVSKITTKLGKRLNKDKDELKPFISYLNKSLAKKRIPIQKQDKLLEILTITGDNFYKKGYHRIKL